MDLYYDAAGLMHLFLVSKAGQKKYKGIVGDYLERLLQAVEIVREDINAEVLGHPDYERTPYKVRSEFWDKCRDTVNDEAFLEVFGNWSTKDWKALNKAYLGQFK